MPSNGTANTLLFGAVRAVVSVVSFAAILWNLSGPLTTASASTFPRAMFWIVFVFVLIATGIAFWIGRPLIGLSFDNEKLNAAFRYALVRLRDAAEAVGFYRGEQAERTQLAGRFTPIIDNYRRFVSRTIVFFGWNLSMTQTIVPLPWLMQAPRLFAGQIASATYAVGVGVRRDPGRAVVLPQLLRRVRRLPRGDHPAARPGRRQRQGP